MTVGELLAILADKPKDMMVCGSGHYGEVLEIYWLHQGKVYRDRDHQAPPIDAMIGHPASTAAVPATAAAPAASNGAADLGVLA